MKKIKVDKEMCMGCGLCTQVDGNDFVMGTDGLSEAVNETVESTNTSVDEAKDACPTGAISVEETEE